MSRVLITGGAGFIGSHLAEHLLARGDSVHVIDDLSTGSMENVQHLLERPDFSLEVDTVSNLERLAAAVEQADRVFHLAAAVGVDLIVKEPLHTIHTNYAGAEAVLDCASRKGVPTLVASTSEVYGKSEALPYREDADLLLGPTQHWRWAYACTKILDEFLALAHHQKRGLPVVVARLFNTVGPRQTGRYGMVLPRFVTQALRGEPITVYGSGQQTRCFCHVADIVPALVALLDTPETSGQIVNLGSQQEVSITGLAEEVRRLVDPSVPIVGVPYDQAYGPGFQDLPRRVPCLLRAQALVGFRPTRSLARIIQDVADYWRGRLVDSEG